MSDTPILFYSRRVGLSLNGQSVPIDAGARVTGRFGRYSLGLIDIQSGDHRPSNTLSTNFTAVRVRRDLLRKSTLGAMYNARSIAQNGVGCNETYIKNRQGRVETRDADAEVAVEYQNGDRPFVAYTNMYEFLPQPFAIASNVTLASKGYQFASTRVGMQLGQQRRVAGVFSVEHGSFYNGTKTTWAWARGRGSVSRRLSVEPRISIDQVKLVEGEFTSKVIGARATFTTTPLMFVSALIQYSSASHGLSSNVRLRWEYTPGSELFIVWNESRDTLLGSFPEMTKRALIVKVNRLLRF